MKSIQFMIRGNPVPQGRPRFASRDRNGNHLPFVKTYDPKNSREWKKEIKRQVIENKHDIMLEGPLKMILIFRLQRPKGHYGKRGLRPSAPKHHIVKPDLDNLEKGLKDSLEGLCYKGDQQVCRVQKKKGVRR